jgi:type III secretory pathway component EscS
MKLIAVVIALFVAGWVGSCIGHWANRHVEPIKIEMVAP